MIRWRDSTGVVHEDGLFGVFAALARGEADSFPALRPHQREPWHAFCAQVAAIALIRSGEGELPAGENDWRQLLLGLTPEWPEGEAWSLVVEDWSKPALLQPATAAVSNRTEYKNTLYSPDELDMLVTAKNHDVKLARMADARAEDWLFALVTLQTFEGFLGAGNYGISRMNGGFASRMSLGVRPGGSAAAGFVRDVERLLVLSDKDSEWRHGLPLLWLEPWDGTVSLSFEKLDTLYVEICRRIRLTRTGERVGALAAGSKVARVAAGELKGRTGDPWAPVKGDGSASVTATAAGFGYRQITRLLNQQETRRPMLAELAENDAGEGLTIVAAALVRGQGKTEGLHRRVIPISRYVSGFMNRRTYLDTMGRVAELRAADAGKARTALRRALLSLLQGGPEQVRLDDDAGGRKADPWCSQFDRLVDRNFFDEPFWSQVAGDPGPHRAPWRERLSDMARCVFGEAAQAAPRSNVRRLRAHVRARSYLDAQLHRFVEELDGE